EGLLRLGSEQPREGRPALLGELAELLAEDDRRGDEGPLARRDEVASVLLGEVAREGESVGPGLRLELRVERRERGLRLGDLDLGVTVGRVDESREENDEKEPRRREDAEAGPVQPLAPWRLRGYLHRPEELLLLVGLVLELELDVEIDLDADLGREVVRRHRLVAVGVGVVDLTGRALRERGLVADRDDLAERAVGERGEVRAPLARRGHGVAVGLDLE